MQCKPSACIPISSDAGRFIQRDTRQQAPFRVCEHANLSTALAKVVKPNSTAWDNFQCMYVPAAEVSKSEPDSPFRTNILFKHSQVSFASTQRCYLVCLVTGSLRLNTCQSICSANLLTDCTPPLPTQPVPSLARYAQMHFVRTCVGQRHEPIASRQQCSKASADCCRIRHGIAGHRRTNACQNVRQVVCASTSGWA